MRIFFTYIALALATLCSAQEPPSFQNTPFYNIRVTYGIDQPLGDLADRFGYNLGVGLNAEYVSSNNWIIGIGAEQKFGNQVKENVLSYLVTTHGDILGANNIASNAYLRMRGNYIGIYTGKIVPIGKHRSGIRLVFGGGINTHKIRVVDEEKSLPQIDGDYITGYDRLTRGIGLKQEVAYQHISNNKLVNFTIGIESIQGINKSIRSYAYGNQTSLKRNRFDMYIGLRIGWILPYYLPYKSEEIYY